MKTVVWEYGDTTGTETHYRGSIPLYIIYRTHFSLEIGLPTQTIPPEHVTVRLTAKT